MKGKTNIYIVKRSGSSSPVEVNITDELSEFTLPRKMNHTTDNLSTQYILHYLHL